MASFVTLIGVDNNEQVVNVDLITRMVRHDTGEGFTEIYFDQGNDVRVRETPAEILGGFSDGLSVLRAATRPRLR
jgi:hypothetical protein